MQATYRLKPSELNEDFIALIKSLFKNNDIEITISNKPASIKKSKKDFLKAVEDVRLRKNLVSFSLDEFESLSEKLSSK